MSRKKKKKILQSLRNRLSSRWLWSLAVALCTICDLRSAALCVYGENREFIELLIVCRECWRALISSTQKQQSDTSTHRVISLFFSFACLLPESNEFGARALAFVRQCILLLLILLAFTSFHFAVCAQHNTTVTVSQCCAH